MTLEELKKMPSNLEDGIIVSVTEADSKEQLSKEPDESESFRPGLENVEEVSNVGKDE